ncbi:hypothetical protein D6779_01645 [Candidatus Parcubacteria bacterium]|nr:MAG: hypothetical protein D6779_01645 [Candidatus Parcubacteria bacterium]
MRNHVVHELGHAFNGRYSGAPMDALYQKFGTGREWLCPNPQGGGLLWQQNPAKTPSEVWADTFLGWVLRCHQDNDVGRDVTAWMDDYVHTVISEK